MLCETHPADLSSISSDLSSYMLTGLKPKRVRKSQKFTHQRLPKATSAVHANTLQFVSGPKLSFGWHARHRNHYYWMQKKKKKICNVQLSEVQEPHFGSKPLTAHICCRVSRMNGWKHQASIWPQVPL